MTKFFVGIILSLSFYSFAGVTITQGTFPYHCYQQSDYKAQLTDIIIAEGANTDFAASAGTVTYEIKTPQNNTGEYQYEFLQDVGAITFRVGGDIVSIDFITIAPTKLTFGYTCPTATARDTIRIHGLQIRSIGWSAYNYYLRRSGGTAVQHGNITAIHATFTNIQAGAHIIAPPGDYFCHNDTNLYLIKAAYPGGTISGTTYYGSQFNSGGYEQIYFKPSLVADTGVFSFHYSVTTSGCTFTKAVSRRICYVPSPTLVSTDTVFCKNDVVTFTAGPAQPGFLYQFQYAYGTTNPVMQLYSSDNTWVFQDNGSGINNRPVFVEVKLEADPHCPARSAPITPVENPEPTLSVMLDPALPTQLCSNSTARTLVPSNYAGGIFSGSGVNGNSFDPLLAALGSNTVTYTIHHPTCGPRTFTTNFTVTAAPSVTLSSSDADNIVCNGNLVMFTAATHGTANRYLFSKNGNGIQGPNLTSTFSSSTLNDGDVVNVTVDNGVSTCATTSNSIITAVGNYPEALFSWNAACGSDVVSFDDQSSITQPGSVIHSWDWDYTDNNSIDLHQGSDPDHSHDYNSYGNFSAKLTVTTNRGCSDSYSVKIATQPTRQPLPTDPYVEEFETDDGAWSNFGGNDSWGWGTSSNVLHSGSKKIWSTGYADGLYKPSEDSYIASPCFNFELLHKPMIAIKLKSAVPDKLAGAILEASTDNGETWQRVGLKGDGVNWYDEVALLASPGENNNGDYGWTGNYSEWKVAKIGLDQFAGHTAVKLRIAFASSTVAQYYNGIAIDSIWIGNRNKLTVIEHFTNLNAGGASFAYNSVAEIQAKRPNDIASLHYHISAPVYDQYSAFNFSDPGARTLYYGVGVPPVTRFDGTAFVDSYKNPQLIFDTNHVDKRVLEIAPYKIDLTTEITSTDVIASAKLTNTGTKPLTNLLVLHLAVVEDSASGNNSASYVLRKLLPDAAGSVFSGYNWPVNRTESVSHKWMNHMLGNGKLSVIAFVQDANTKEILQAAIVRGTGNYGDPVEVGITEPLADEFSIQTYPNPVNEYLNINPTFEEAYKIQLISLSGVVVKEVGQKKGEMNVFVGDVEDGTYILKVIAENGKYSIKKITILR